MIIVAYLSLSFPRILGTLVGSGTRLFTFGFLLVICTVAAFFIVQAFLVAWILFINVVRFGLGPTLFQTALLRVTSELTPLGLWEVRTFAATRDVAHSEIHEDPEVATAIWDFTEECRQRRESSA
jgi:hypothetical protein